MRYSRHIVVAFLISLMEVGNLPGQTPQQIQWLHEFAIRNEQEWDAQQAEADTAAVRGGFPIFVTLSDSTVMRLIRLDQGVPRYYAGASLAGAQTVSTDSVWPNGGAGLSLTGQGITFAMWDEEGVYLNHPEFDGRIVQRDGGVASGPHATKVAGVLIAEGLNPSSKGMAYEASVDAYDLIHDRSEMANAAASGTRLSNHSYEQKTGWVSNYLKDGRWAWLGDVTVSNTEDYYFGFYDILASKFDSIAYAAPYYLIVTGARNNRDQHPPQQPIVHWVFNNMGPVLDSTTVSAWDGGVNGYDGYDCLHDFGVSKNVLVVGAVYPIVGGYKLPSDVKMTNFSSWGPTDDGRIKPDVVGDGYEVWTTIPDTGHSFLQGTSGSAPNITGSLALLLQEEKDLIGNTKLLASTYRALVIHTADESGTTPGPDYKFGWGLMNTLKAARVMEKNFERSGDNIREIALVQGQTFDHLVRSSGLEPLRATICWTDPPHDSLPKSLDPPTPLLVNDLDLRIIGPSSTTYYPYRLDKDNPAAAATTGDNAVDNVEQVHIQNPPAGLYTVRITHKGSLVGAPQMVSLIVTGEYRVDVTVDQKVEGGASVDSVGRWEGASFRNYPVPSVFGLADSSIEVLRGAQKIISGQKYSNWNALPDVTNHHTFYVTAGTGTLTSNFKSTDTAVTVMTELVDGGVTGGTLGFRDPWLIDSVDASHGYTSLNRGPDHAKWHDSLPSPFYPDTLHAYDGFKYNGVFLNEGGNLPNLTPPYYSVRVPPQQTIGTHQNCNFIGWAADSALFQNVSALETPVVFKSANDVVKARYKGHLISSSNNATEWNGQRKLVNWGGVYHLVYQSAGDIWYSSSTDNGATWIPEQKVSENLEGIQRLNPAIDVISDGSVFVVYEILVDSTHRALAIKRGHNAGWDWFNTGETFMAATDMKPVIEAGSLTVVLQANGYDHYDPGLYSWNSGYIDKVSETSASSMNPTIVWYNLAYQDGNAIYHTRIDYTTTPISFEPRTMVSTDSYNGRALTNISNPSIAIRRVGDYEISRRPVIAWQATDQANPSSRPIFARCPVSHNADGTPSFVTTVFDWGTSNAHGKTPTVNCYGTPELLGYEYPDVSVAWQEDPTDPNGSYSNIVVVSRINGTWGPPVSLTDAGQNCSIALVHESMPGADGTLVTSTGTAGPPYAINRDRMPSSITLSSSVPTGWNLLSIPALLGDYFRYAVYPMTAPGSGVFRYESAHGYIDSDTLSTRRGYWVKVPNDTFVAYSGLALDSATIHLDAGWNMVGTISTSLDVNTSVTTEPSGIASDFYHYTGSAYDTTRRIYPGVGYWVKASQSGELKLNVSGVPPSAPGEQPPEAPGGAPPRPTLLLPSDGATYQNLTLTLVWNSDSGATQYRVQVSTDPYFGVTLVNVGSLTGTSFQIGGLSEGTQYYWRVNAGCSEGTSDWSDVWGFTTYSHPLVPTLASPANGSVDQALSPILSWNLTQGAEHYRLQVSADPGFGSVVFDDSSVTSTARQVGALNNSTTYYWRVYGLNRVVAGAWSSTWSFTTAYPPPAPVLLSPINGATDQSTIPTLSWNASSGAVSYTLEIAYIPTFESILQSYSGMTGVTSKQVAHALEGFTTYYWRVSAWDSIGTSAWSTVWHFTTGQAPVPNAPALLFPGNGSSGLGTEVILEWGGSQYATFFRVQLAINPSFSSTIVNTTTGGITWLVGELTDGMTYYWRVNAQNNGGASPWSSVWSFTVGTAPPGGPCDPEGPLMASLDQFMVSDAHGGHQKLFVRKGSQSSGFRTDEMPPEPPPGLFDARFHSGKMVESIPTLDSVANFHLRLRDAAYPVTLSWNLHSQNGLAYRIGSGALRGRWIPIADSGNILLEDPRDGMILVQATSSDPCDPSRTRAMRPPAGEVPAIPRVFALHQNYPNPFNPETQIRYDLPQDCQVSLVVYDVLGREVVRLIDEAQGAGYKEVRINSARFTSGVYFYRLQAGSFTDVKKMILIK